MKKNKSSKNWIINQHRDQYFKKAKIEGYRSRAAFKLIEINSKFNIIKKDSNLLDLGSCPGGWSQVASKIVSKGKIVSVDIKEMKPINNVKFVKKDFLQEESQNFILSYFGKKIDVIISDMAADTTGIKDLDSIRTNLICLEVLDFSSKLLNSSGNLVSKIFMGQDFELIKKKAKKKFNKVNFYKPESSRSNSKETYIHCKGLKTL
tara:strand:- start:2275 stop:2892 length:618 start_codon:yes stop_codon:yes gene_type:complete